MRPLLRNLLAASLLLTLACSQDPEPAVDAGIGLDAGQEQDAGLPPGDAGTGAAIESAESSDALCSNGVDDDGSGYTDCDDYWCRDSVTVTVCGALENTAALCSDGQDNVETPLGTNKPRTDGLVDCADPDCFKNPALDVCPPLAFELGAKACANGADDDADGVTDCEDPDCLHAGASNCPLGDKKRVLFDDAHRARAGSADWVVDVPGRHPWPSMPAAETDWAGNLSSFGKDLMDTGRFVVETLPPHGRLGFGASAEQDLADYAVLVMPEPSAPLTAEEARAVVDFVKAGGGLLMVADHAESDRDGNGCDSVGAFNELLAAASEGGLEQNPFGFSVANVGYSASGDIERKNARMASTLDPAAAGHPVLDGPHGAVAKVGMNKGGLFTLHAPDVAAALIHALPLDAAGSEGGSPYVVAAEVGQGRVVAIGDSSILNDGTDSHGYADPYFDSWHEGQQDNAKLVLNALEWLAQ